MRRTALVLVLLLAAASPAAAGFDEEYDLAARALLCDCGCSPQSVHDCACGRAAEMREEIAAKIRAGQTGQQILDEAVALHGEKVLISPPLSGFNLLAWLGPGTVLLLGLVGVALMARRWRRAAAAAQDPTAPTVLADDPYVARLERELREFE